MRSPAGAGAPAGATGAPAGAGGAPAGAGGAPKILSFQLDRVARAPK